jgi:MYXO-CTERM domain-containing protein
MSFAHPGTAAGPICTAQQASCTVTVTTADGQSASKTVGVSYAPVFSPPTGVQLQVVTAGVHPGDPVEVSATAIGECPSDQTYLWQATLRSAGTLWRKQIAKSFSFPVPPVCGKDIVDIQATSVAAPVTGTAMVLVESSDGPPSVSEPIATNFEPQEGARFACEDPQPVVIRPDYKANCSPRFVWEDLTKLPVAMTDLGDGAIALTPTDFAATTGRTGRYQLTVEDAAGHSTPQVFEVRFLPEPFVHLDHRADRATATPGEMVRLSVGFGYTSGCSAPLDGLDLHLALSGLDFLSGSARLDGQPIPDPEKVEGELVFRALPLAGGARPVLSYAARRVGSSSAAATASARAFLSTFQNVEVSDESGAASKSGAGELAPLSCNCQSSGGPLFAGLALGSLALATRRRRRRPC